MEDRKPTIKERIKEVVREALGEYEESFLVDDFFYAPYQLKGKYSEVGGLAHYCIDVLNEMFDLIDCLHLKINVEDRSIIKLAIFHCYTKIYEFKEYAKNVKVYEDNGTEFDELGKFNWKSVLGFTYTEIEEKPYCPSPRGTILCLESQGFALSDDEKKAILYYNENTSWEKEYMLQKCPLITLLHLANQLVLYIGVTNE